MEEHLSAISETLSTGMPGLKSLILGGSFGRDEGTMVILGDTLRPFKDYDLFAVVEQGLVREAAARIPTLRERIYRALDLAPYSEEHPSPGRFQISLEIIPLNALPYLPNDISNAELKLASRLLWGQDLRERIPADPSRIHPVSGLRPVLNKLIGILEQWGPWVDEGHHPGSKLACAIVYHKAKVILDASAALLLLRGKWVPGYAARLDVARDLERAGPLHPQLGLLTPRIEEALQIKLDPLKHEPDDPAQLWEAARKELLEIVEIISSEVLGYEPAAPENGYCEFLAHARWSLLGPYAEDLLRARGLPFATRFAPFIVAAYSLAESVRIRNLHLIHPLIRSYACAWAWVGAGTGPEEQRRISAWIRPLLRGVPESRPGMRQGIIELFKAISTKKRIKRSFT